MSSPKYINVQSPCLLDGQGYGLEHVVHLVVNVPHIGDHSGRVPGQAGGAVAAHWLMMLMVVVT